MGRIQFKNMETAEHAEECEGIKSLCNSDRFSHFYTRYAYDQNSGRVINPERVNVERFFTMMKLNNATTKYKNEIYTMYTGLFENGHVFLIAPRQSYRVVEDPNTNNPNKVMFSGDTLSVDANAIYSGISFQEIKKLIRLLHSNTPLSNHISHILDHEYR